jgi:hypothetical protein
MRNLWLYFWCIIHLNDGCTFTHSSSLRLSSAFVLGDPWLNTYNCTRLGPEPALLYRESWVALFHLHIRTGVIPLLICTVVYTASNLLIQSNIGGARMHLKWASWILNSVVCHLMMGVSFICAVSVGLCTLSDATFERFFIEQKAIIIRSWPTLRDIRSCSISRRQRPVRTACISSYNN